MRRPYSAGCSCGLLVIGCILLLLCAGMGMVTPLDVLLNLAAGWAIYTYRVLPHVRPSGAGILTAVICLIAISIGLHLFLRWLYGQLPAPKWADGAIIQGWPIRRTGAIIGLIVLMFVAGVSLVGISHQTAWLFTSPEPLTEGGIRQAAARAESQNNLHQLAIAMHSYQEQYGTLPPAARYDREGQPFLSWRVLILPYVEQGNLYQQFHLDEPWDSPHNLRLLPRMPKVYAPPLAKESSESYGTCYQVFTGKGTAFEGRRGLRLPEDFPDGAANTILIVEAAELVPWTKPQDLPYHPADPLPALGSLSPDYFQAAMADGTAPSIFRTDPEASIRARITRNGGEVLSQKEW